MSVIIATLNTIMQSCKHDYPLVQTARCAFVTRTRGFISYFIRIKSRQFVFLDPIEIIGTFVIINTVDNSSILHPIIRWAGGKTWLVKYLSAKLDIGQFVSYHEPFVGGAAVLLHFKPDFAWISDSNRSLIETYKSLRRDPERIICILQEWGLTQQDYYHIRNLLPTDSSIAAARFLYLNHTSYNGLYRENRDGQYNVPWGHRERVDFDFENLINVAKYLETIHIRHNDFLRSLDQVQEGSLVFLDPPYTITHNKNGFVAYNQKIFSMTDQYRLSSMIDKIKRKGAYYILTNAAHDEVKRIFTREGDKMFVLSRSSLIGGKNANRGKYEECIFTNLDISL